MAGRLADARSALFAGVRPVDAAIGLGLFAIGLADSLTTNDYTGGRSRLVFAMTLQTLPIVWQRARTVVAVAVSLLGVAIEVAGQIPYGGIYGFLGFLLLVHAVARWTEGSARTTGLALLAVGILLHTLAMSDRGPLKQLGSVIVTLAFSAAAWTVGSLGRRAQDRQTALEAEQATLIAAERASISRELHDIVGHALAGISLTAGATEHTATDPQVAAALRLIGTTSRGAATDVRRLVGYLREGDSDSDSDTVPLPSLDSVPTLVAAMREAGLDVENRVEGMPVSAPGGLQLAAYRVIQEGLTNAAKHAPGVPAEVLLRWLPGSLEVSVGTDTPATPPKDEATRSLGHGLVGLQERVAMYDGTMVANATPEGGFLLRARFPL